MASKQENDPWTILPEDRVKYEAQFLQLGPVNGLITGEKVKSILMKSGLSTAVLGHIWGLSDINGDGKLDKKEFAIAIHLIRKKLQGIDLPKTLPSSLKADPPPPPASAPVIAEAPQKVQPTKTVSSPPEALSQGPVASVARPVASSSASGSVPGAISPPSSVPLKSSAKPSSSVVSPPSSTDSSVTKPSASSVASPGGGPTGIVWAIPASELAKYQQLFLSKDPKKRGFLTGLEAKTVLSQFGLPVKVLAQIWNLADIDDDGRLVLEEFQLAMHFVGVAKSGKPVPSSLPPELIPPSYQKVNASGGTAGKVTATGAKGSTGPTTVPSIQPPAGVGKKSSDPVSAVKSVPVAAPPVSAPVVSSAPKPSVDLLLLDDPFGAPPAELPVPLLEQALASKSNVEEQKIPNDTTPPNKEFSCSVVWNVETEIVVDGEAREPELEDLATLDADAETSVASPSDVSGIAEPEDKPGVDMVTMDNVKPISVPELQITTVEDAPASDDEVVESVDEKKTENFDEALDNEAEQQAEEDRRLAERKCREEEEQKQLEREKLEREKLEREKLEREKLEREKLEREKQLKLEQDMQELERLRQVELENQRQLELEKQKQAELERQRRLEAERQRLEELEKLRKLELERQKMMEKEKEEQRRKAQEQKEAAQRELQKQRQLDWEHQRRDQLIVLQARCQNVQDQLGKDITRLKNDLATENNKKSDLKNKIEKTRSIVGEYTSAIETMRLIRDKKLADINSVQMKIEESKRRLAVCQQERQLLDTQLLSCDQHLNDTYKVILKSCSKKKATVDGLNEQLSKIDEETGKKMEMIESNNTKLTELKNRMNALHAEVKTIQHTLVGKKQQWDTKTQFGQASSEEAKIQKPTELVESDQELLANGYEPYVALYQFDGRSADELSLQPGVTVWVRPDQAGQESGWMIGRLKGVNGCFPEAYVRPANEKPVVTSSVAPAIADEAKMEEPECVASSDIDAEKLDDSDGHVISTLATSEQSSFVSVPSSLISAEEAVVDRGLKAQAIYSWMAKKDNHLTFNKGDIIAIKEQQEMWWSGELNEKIGWFPKSYVKLIDEGEGGAGETSSETATAISGSVLGSEPSVEVSAVVEPSEHAEELYVAAYPYVSDEPGDLTFKQGDLISVTKSDGEWWTGSIGGHSGIFPANFVKKMETPAEISLPASVPEETAETGQKLSAVKKPEIATVIAAYEATGAEQLSLQPGQLIQVRKKTDSGWWEGELQVRGQKRRIGWFPANYVKLLGQGGTSRSSVDNSGSCSETPKPLDVKLSLAKLSADDSGTEEKMMALYDYQSQCEDELSFAKGDIICIVSKDHAEWWKGKTAGKVGIFPANFVGPLSENLPE